MRHLSWFAGLLIGLGAVAAGPAHAQTYTYSIYVDNDASSSTGCAENGFAGAEVRLQVTASGGTTPTIASATQSTCSGGAFGAAAPLSGGAALGFSNGLGGSDVIELAVDEAFLRAGTAPLRVGVAAVSADGIDQLYSADGGNGPPIGFGRGAVPLPLLGAPMLVLMALLLLGFGARRARRWRLVAMLLAISGGTWAAHFVVDGQTSDWAGMSPLATDPAGDASSGETAIDLRALFAAIENHRAFFRIDLTDLQGNQGNPPLGNPVAATTREDTPVTLTLTGSGAQGGVLTFAITSAPLHGTLGALTPAGADSATVTYTPDPDANGSDGFAYTVSDGQSTSVPVDASLTITPVNDAPQFTAQDPPKVSENAGPQAVTAATAIAAGPPTAVDEAGQALDFIITANDNPALFAATPSISADGVLHYEPAAGANGSAALSVVLHDDGGTADGGVDTSAPQTITVTVGAVNDPPVLSAGATLAYTENDPASVIDATLTASDPDSANLAGATVRISAGYQDGADRLGFVDTAKISGVWEGASATLTLSGDDTVANYQAALRTVTYVNSSDDPATEARTVTWTASDGAADSAPVTSTITVTAVNDAPTISAGGTLAYTEADPPTPVDATVTVSDPDNADLAGATVQVSAGYVLGEDVLAFASSGGISAGFDAASGTLTLSGTASLAAYQTALRAVTYANASKNPSLAPRTVSWQASDASATSNVATSTITVAAVKNAPVLAAGATLAYTENDPASVIDATLTARDPDSANLAGATVRISVGYQDGADRLGFADTATISGIWDGASATLTLSGDDTVANYQAALRTVTYVNTSDDPATDARTVTWIASDGSASSAPVTSAITVAAVNDPPMLAGGVSLTYTEDDPATPVDPTLTVADPDSTDLAGATVQISAGYVMGEDVLAFASSGGISASFDAASGTLTLSGIDSLANYEAALRGVTYANLSQNPSTATRTLSFQVSDGALVSNVINSSVDVVAVNDAPVLTAGAAVTYTEGDPALIADATLTVGDVDNTTLAGASVQITANFGGTQDLLAFTPVGAISGSYDPASGTLALSGADTLANYQTALRSVTYRNTSHDPSTATRTLGWSATDGSATSAVVTSTVAIVSVNSAPSFTKGADQTVLEDAGAQTIAPWATGLDDGDGGDQTLSFEVTANTNPGLFAVAPAVSPSGALTYTPAADANGTATITLVLHDNGGTANGGVDTSAAQTFVINVTAVNDAPAFTRGSNVTVLQNAAAQTINPWATAISTGPADEAGQALTFQVTGNTNPALFSAAPSVSPSGVLTFTPATNVAGTATLTLVLHDDGGTANGGVDTSAAQTFTISVTAVNQAPSFTKGADQAVNEDAGAQVVTPWASAISQGPGDSGQALTFVVTGNSNPTLFSAAPTVSASGALSYTPAPDANGSATITLELHDDGGTANGGVDTSAAQTFVITVTPVNDAPAFTRGSNVTVLQNAAAQTINPWATAISAGPADEAGQALTFQVTGNTNPALFSAAPSVSPSGVLTFTPATNVAGTATLTLVLHDDGGTANGGVDTSAAQTFTISVTAVNQAPSFTKGADQAVNEDAGAQVVTPWASAISQGPGDSGQALTFVVTGNSNPTLFSAAPTVSASGALSYTPAPDANGSATITLELHDDGGTANGGVDTSAAQTFTITVNAVNDAPSFTKGPDVSVLEDSGPHTVDPWATAISPGPADESAQTVSFNVTANTNPGLFATAPVVSASGALSFTPAADTAGSATITLVAKDNGGTANGGVDTSAAQTFTITVERVNHAPTFTPGGNVTVNEDSGAYTAAWASAIDDGDAGVTQALDFIVGNNNAALFAAPPAISATGVLSFTPAPDANGSAQVTVRLHDDGGTANGGVDTSAAQTFTITVNAVNDPPSFTKGPDVSVLEDSGPQTVNPWATAISAGPANESAQTVAFNVTANTNPGLFAAAPSVSASGVLSFTPAPNTAGSATITLVAKDDGGTANGGIDSSAAQTFTITVLFVNHAPTFTPGGNVTVNEDSGAYTAAWASAIDDGDAGVTQALDFIVGNDNAALFAVAPAISATGVLSFTPAPDANGSAQVTVRLHDDGGTADGGADTSAAQTFTITVNAVNDPPSFTKGPDVSVLEDSGPQTVNPWATAISAGPANESAQTVAFNVTANTNPGLFAVPPAVSASGALSFTPAPNTFGSATITLVAKDNGGTANGGVDTSAAQTFTITVLFVNHAPTFTPGGNVTVNEDSGAYAAAWASAIDDGDAGVTQALDFIVGNDNAGLFAAPPAISATGVLSFTPAPDANGSAQVTVRLHDDGGTANGGVDTSAPQTFTITVNPVNDPPVAVAHVLQTHSGIGVVIGPGDSGLLKDGASDIDNAFGDLSISATFTNITPAGATVTLLDAATGAYRYDPPPGYHGAASFDYTVCDSGIPTPPAQCASATVSVTVTGPDLWFVDAAAPAGGTGRLADPFKSLASLPAARGTGDRIFVASGTYASGHTLNDGEELIGAGASGSTFDALFGVVVPANGTLATRPTLGGTAPTVQGTLTMSNDSRVQGVAIASGANPGLVASGKTNLKVSQSSVTSSTTAVDIANSTAAASGVRLTSTTSSGGATGIKLASLGSGGAFDFGTGSLNGHTATGFSLASGSASVSYAGDISPAAAGRPVDISGVGSVGTAISLGGSIVASVGIRVGNNSGGTITLSGASQKLTTTTGTAVDLSTNAGATVNFSGGGLVIATTSGAGFSAVGGGTVSVTGNGNAVASGNGTAVTVQNTSIGGAGMRFQSVASSGAPNGIVLSGTGVGAFTVDGGGASDPANLTRGRTTAKQGGGTLTLGAGGTLNASSGVGVTLANVGGDVLLRNMVVQGGAAEGIKADVVSGLRLDNVRVVGHANFSGLAGTAVTGLTLQHVEFQGNGSSASAGSNHYWGIRFGQRSPCGACADGLAGVATVTNSLITNANEYVFGLVNRNSSVLNLTLANNQISDTASSGAGAFAFSAEAWNGANVSITATGNLFSNSRSTAFNYAGNDSSGGGAINLSGNQFANNGVDAGIAHQGIGKTIVFTMDNNTTRQTLVPGSSVSLSALVGGAASAATQLKGTMSNNMVGNTSIADSGSVIGAGMAVEARGPGTLTLRADANKVSQVRQDTAFLVSANTDTSGTNRLNLSASNNDLRSSTTSGLGYSGLELYSGGNGGGDNTHVCAHLTGNVAFIGDPFAWGVGAENLAAASDIALEGYAGAANNVSALMAYLNTTATTVTPSAAVFLAAGAIKAAPGPCPIP